MKKNVILIVLLLFLSIILNFSNVFAFNDVKEDDWFHDYVNLGVEKGIFDKNDNFYPHRNLNRAELAKISVILAIDSGNIIDFDTFNEFQFHDVPQNEWYYKYVMTGYNYGLFEGYSDNDGNLTGYFGPADTVTRTQAAKVILNAMDIDIATFDIKLPFFDLEDDAWYLNYVKTVYVYNIMEGYKDKIGNKLNLFGPNDNVTRAEISKIMINSIEFYDDVWECIGGCSTYEGINYDPNTANIYSQEVSTIDSNNNLYVFWIDEFEQSIRYKSYDNDWQSYENKNIKYNIESNIFDIVVTKFYDQIYAFWAEYLNDNDIRLRTKKYEDNEWVSIEGEVKIGINVDNDMNVRSIASIESNNYLYVVWIEDEVYVRIKRYDGTKWQSIPNVNYLNYNTQDTIAYNPDIKFFQGNIYVIWSELNLNTQENLLRMKKYDGENMIEVLNGNLNYINYNKNYKATSAQMTIHKNQLYIVWAEEKVDGAQKPLSLIRIKAFDGQIFQNFNLLNYNQNAYASNPNIASFNNKLYVTWVEKDEDDIMQIRVKRYNGKVWNFIDSNQYNTLNIDNTQNAYMPKIIQAGYYLYLVWVEGEQQNIKARRIKIIGN